MCRDVTATAGIVEQAPDVVDAAVASPHVVFAGDALDDVGHSVGADPIPDDREQAADQVAIDGGASGEPCGVVHRGGLEGLVPGAPVRHGPCRVVETHVDGAVQERSVEHVQVLDAEPGDGLVGLASHIERGMFPGGGGEQVETVVRGNDAPGALFAGGAGQRHLAVDQRRSYRAELGA